MTIKSRGAVINAFTNKYILRKLIDMRSDCTITFNPPNSEVVRKIVELLDIISHAEMKDIIDNVDENENDVKYAVLYLTLEGRDMYRFEFNGVELFCSKSNATEAMKTVFHYGGVGMEGVPPIEPV